MKRFVFAVAAALIAAVASAQGTAAPAPAHADIGIVARTALAAESAGGGRGVCVEIRTQVLPALDLHALDRTRLLRGRGAIDKFRHPSNTRYFQSILCSVIFFLRVHSRFLTLHLYVSI